MEFNTPLALSKVLIVFKKPWYIAGGWAIDLYLGIVTHAHKDIEIAIFRKDQRELYEYLDDWFLYKVIPGQEKMETWMKMEWLSSPIHEIHAISKVARKNIDYEILLNESDHQYWYFRRNLKIQRSLFKIGKVGYYGIPYLSPELVLLYKAKDYRYFDFNDFIQSIDLLTIEERIWLNKSLRCCYPSHPWLAFFPPESSHFC